MRSRPIDYSKWDHLDTSDDEDEEEKRGPPRVTHFNEPMSVTVGGHDHLIPSRSPAPSPSSTTPHPASRIEDISENGQSFPTFTWRQDRGEAIMHIWAPPCTRAKDVQVTYTRDTNHLSVRITTPTAVPVLVEGPLANPIQLEEGEEVEWEMVGEGGREGGRGGGRAVRVSLIKSTPRPDMVHWWSRVFVGDDEIDTSRIAGRKMNFQGAWEEAQRRFREDVARRNAQGPVEVEVEGEVEGEGEGGGKLKREG
ncbi:CS-like domain protein [Nannochloropsis gaditana]|uniref:CS-like domain protein n=1 Tax=Nannochloropsis gaditana TaxID=72520 RepID=W7TNN6_9STRA|nr:CS-like domain protein [Nannochloropsis gaditana]